MRDTFSKIFVVFLWALRIVSNFNWKVYAKKKRTKTFSKNTNSNSKDMYVLNLLYSKH
jgi:hypothetical protein